MRTNDIEKYLQVATELNFAARYDESEKNIHDALTLIDVTNFTTQLTMQRAAEFTAIERKSTGYYLQAAIILGQIAFRKGDYSKAFDHFTTCLTVSTAIGDTDKKAKSLWSIGNVYYALSEYFQALEFYKKAVAYYKQIGNREDGSKVIGNIANVYTYLCDYLPALELYQEALEIHEELGAIDDIARVNSNIGLLYHFLQDEPRAIEYLTRSLEMQDRVADKAMLVNILCNLGNSWIRQVEYESGLEMYFKALNLAEKIGLKLEISGILGNIGLALYNRSDFDKALEYFDKSIAIAEEIGDQAGIALNIGYMGFVYMCADFSGHNLHTAEKYLLQSISILEKIGKLNDALEAHKDLANVYKQLKNWEKFAFHFETYHNLEKEMLSFAVKKEAEQFIHKREIVLKTLEHEILISKNKELEQANHFKSKLLAIAAHDLKNPLNNILGAAQIVIDDMSNDIHYREWLSVIKDSAYRMRKLINELLESSTASLGAIQLSLATVDMGQMVGYAAKLHDVAIHNKKQVINIRSSEGILVQGDEQRLIQVVENLVSNASKYSPVNSSILLTVVKQEDSVVLSVTDQGQGLSEDDISKLFGQFQKLSSTPTGDESSTGLGLYIVKYIVEKHNGTIWAESKGKGKGSTFYVRLPAMTH